MVELSQLPPATRFILQGGSAARAAAGEAFGVSLSETACRTNTREGRAALWLGPDEQLLLGPPGDREVLTARLESALAGFAHSLVEISQRQVAVQVSGSCASTILNTGCPLDLDPVAFPPGTCTRTLLGKAEIIIWRTGAEAFHLEVWRSFSNYVLAWLREADRLHFRCD